jgi:hypothetical protein
VEDMHSWPEVAQVCEPHVWRHAKDTVVGSMKLVVHEPSMVDVVRARATRRLRDALASAKQHVTVQVCDSATSDALVAQSASLRVNGGARPYMPALLTSEANAHLAVLSHHDHHHAHHHDSHHAH